MKLNLSKWLRPASASTEELAEQLEKAEQQYSDAVAATQAAREAFDTTGATSAENALVEAEDVERRARVHVDRAKRLLTAAQERDAAEHRRQLEAEAESLTAELKRLREQARRGPEVEAEVAALLAVADARVERWRLTHQTQETSRRLTIVQNKLGHTVRLESHISDAPYAHAVDDRLTEIARSLRDDPRTRLLHALTPNNGDYSLHATSEQIDGFEPLAKGAQ